jgi:hypothetical protein
MSTPVIEHIALYLNSLVNGITVANGYNYDLTAVRPKCLSLNKEDAKDKSVIIQQGDTAEDELIRGASPEPDIREWKQPFCLVAIVYEDASEPVDAKMNKIRSDIEKAIGVENRDHPEGERCGGYAGYLNVNKPDYLEYDQFTGVVVNVTVEYRVAADDPYTVMP